MNKSFRNEANQSGTTGTLRYMNTSRMALNGATNALQAGCGLIISFWLTRHLIHTMGAAQYGMYPLTKNIVEYFSLVTALVVVPAGRNLMVEHARDQNREAALVFNSFFFGVAALLCALVPLLAAVAWWSPALVKTLPGIEGDVRLLFGAVAVSFVLTTLSAPFGLATFVKNSLYLKHLGDFVELVVFAAVAAVLTGWAGWGLPALACAAAARAIIRLGWAVGCKARLLPEIPIKPALFNATYLRDIFSMSGWFLVSTAGTLLFVGSDLLIVNRILGPDATGRYGSVLILFNALSNVSGMITGVMNPPLMNCYAREGRDRFVAAATRYSRLAGVVIAVPIGLVCGFAAPILTVWLGPSFASLAPVLVVIAAPLLLEIAMVPVATLRLLEKKLRTPSLMYLALGVVKIVMGAALAAYTEMALMGIALGTTLFLVLNAGIVTPLYCSRIAGKSPLFFYRGLIPGVAGLCFMVLASRGAQLIMPAGTVIELGTAAAVVCAAYGLFAWFVLLDKDHKAHISTRIARVLKRGK